MGLVFWDAALRGAAATQFLLLAFLFGRNWRQSLTARLGVMLTLGGAAYVILLAIDANLGFHWWRVPLHLMSLSAPPLFWLFASSWFDDNFELRAWHWAAVIIVVFCGFAANMMFRIDHLYASPLGISWRVFSLIAVSLGLRASLKGRAGDLVESRRRIRLAIAVMVSVVIGWIVLAEIGLHRWPPPDSWRATNAFAMFAMATTILLATIGWRDPALVAAPAKPVVTPDRPEADDSALLSRLDDDMRTERLYRQDGLTITTVAARLGVPEYRLRRAINQGLGARNFNAYLNGFRLGEARDALADPEQREVPILTIALDAGFGSLAPFNRAFRDSECCTPTEYRARALVELSKPTG